MLVPFVSNLVSESLGCRVELGCHAEPPWPLDGAYSQFFKIVKMAQTTGQTWRETPTQCLPGAHVELRERKERAVKLAGPSGRAGGHAPGPCCWGLQNLTSSPQRLPSRPKPGQLRGVPRSVQPEPHLSRAK